MSMHNVGALQRLHDELAGRGWTVRLASEVLHVANPACGLNDKVTCGGGQFQWPWATAPIGPAGDVPGAADSIMHVLRAVAE